MSLVRIALRIAAVEALKGRTRVGDNVLDSPNGALDIQADGLLRTDEDKPFVSVFTDDAVAEDVSGRSLFENGVCTLVIEAGVSVAMVGTNDKGESMLLGVNVPASDRAFEFLLDLIQRDVADALMDPDNGWADIWRSLSSRVIKTEVGAKRTSANGQKLAGHQTRIWLDLVPDPVKGEPLDPDAPMGRFLAALEASTDVQNREHAQTLRSVLGADADPDWKVHQRRGGLTGAELLALGRGPIQPDLPRETPAFGGVLVDRAGLYETVEIGP